MPREAGQLVKEVLRVLVPPGEYSATFTAALLGKITMRLRATENTLTTDLTHRPKTIAAAPQ